jgi:hypothetical protein
MNSAIFASFVDPCQVGRSHELYSAVPPHAGVGSLHLAMARYTCKGIFPITKDEGADLGDDISASAPMIAAQR